MILMRALPYDGAKGKPRASGDDPRARLSDKYGRS